MLILAIILKTMLRRNFVKLSAMGLAAVISAKVTYATGFKNLLINYPDEAWVKLNDNWIKLIATSGSVFSYRDINVAVKTTGNARSVDIQAPDSALQAVKLIWKHQTGNQTKVLGDHWERTYGDVAWKAPVDGVKNPWYVLLYDGRQTACFGVKTGTNSICSWEVKNDSIVLMMDTHSGGVGVKLGQRTLHAADIVTYVSQLNESPFATATRFCSIMCTKTRLPKQPVYGINDWYYAYGENSPQLIKEQTAIMADLVTDTSNRPFSVIDAGWAEYSPLLPGDCCWQDDFSRPNAKFKDMHKMAADITALGMRPGLWTRPLCAKHNDKLSLLAPVIKGRDNPKNPILDPTIPENIERVKGNIAVYNKWGYEMVKHDFTTYDITGQWGFQMTDHFTAPGWKFYDQTKTNAEIINHLYQEIRQSAGDMYLIGCNTLSHLSAGIFEINRIGDDTSGKEWERTRKMGVNTLGFRLPQHNTFYAADGDCVGLTKDVPWDKNKQWLQLLAECGAPLFVSAQINFLGTDQKAAIKQAFAQAAKVQPTGEPLEWLTDQFPAKWKLNNREVLFNWS